jgi:hypothetical protein
MKAFQLIRNKLPLPPTKKRKKKKEGFRTLNLMGVHGIVLGEKKLRITALQ